MFLLSTLLTEKQIKYDHLLQSCNHLSGRELELRKLKMQGMAEDIQKLRESITNKVYAINKKV